MLAGKREASMAGIVVDDPETISEIIGDGTVKKIATLKKNSESEFGELQKAVDDKIDELVSGINEGRIDIHPMHSKNRRLACEYCPYLSICRFDLGFRGCSYNYIG